MESYLSQEDNTGIDSTAGILVANLSRAALELDPRRVVSNLAGLIDNCARDDRRLLQNDSTGMSMMEI